VLLIAAGVGIGSFVLLPLGLLALWLALLSIAVVLAGKALEAEGPASEGDDRSRSEAP
jgi:hypothetical protein